jgi:hypothetical protein
MMTTRALSSHFPDRTVITCDPRGLGRSTREAFARKLRDVLDDDN